MRINKNLLIQLL